MTKSCAHHVKRSVPSTWYWSLCYVWSVSFFVYVALCYFCFDLFPPFRPGKKGVMLCVCFFMSCVYMLDYVSLGICEEWWFSHLGRVCLQSQISHLCGSNIAGYWMDIFSFQQIFWPLWLCWEHPLPLLFKSPTASCLSLELLTSVCTCASMLFFWVLSWVVNDGGGVARGFSEDCFQRFVIKFYIHSAPIHVFVKTLAPEKTAYCFSACTTLTCCWVNGYICNGYPSWSKAAFQSIHLEFQISSRVAICKHGMMSYQLFHLHEQFVVVLVPYKLLSCLGSCCRGAFASKNMWCKLGQIIDLIILIWLIYWVLASAFSLVHFQYGHKIVGVLLLWSPEDLDVIDCGSYTTKVLVSLVNLARKLILSRVDSKNQTQEPVSAKRGVIHC